MNAVEIEEAVSALAAAPFDAGEFPYQFLAAFSFGETTIKKLRADGGKGSDVAGALLLRNHIHMMVTEPMRVEEGLSALRESERTVKGRVKFILATDGDMLVAEQMIGAHEALSLPFAELAAQFAFFFPLAGISTVAEIRNNPIDIKATSRLNKLYVELLKDNPDWAKAEKRPALNQFMARLIFCFFAEDTNIFVQEGVFSKVVREMSDAQSTNTHAVIAELFRAMNTPNGERAQANVKAWANAFPYVNGGLYRSDDGVMDCPRFSKMARSYLLRCGELDWKQINPDIFGSMIQAVADDDERGSLGMHYTSVPNILKVLDPLFLDDVRAQLTQAGDNARKLLNLRKRIAKIRVFDPACGSGNFLVIAYLKLREIEHQICELRKDSEQDKKTQIPLTNFYGIEIKSFPAEIARLALLIAEFQSNVRYIGQREACRDVLPLHNTGQIVCGNALHLDWLEVCPPPHKASEASEPEPAAETYICGNPPYKGSKWQSDEQKKDLGQVLGMWTKEWRPLDYVAGWFMKAARYSGEESVRIAFVSTNSICQGQQVAILWPLIFSFGLRISFACTSFTWSNLASNKAGVTVVVVGIDRGRSNMPFLMSVDSDGVLTTRNVHNINAYLVPAPTIEVERRARPLSALPEMVRGNSPTDDGNLLLNAGEMNALALSGAQASRFIRRFYGSAEFIRGIERYCLWIDESTVGEANSIIALSSRIKRVAEFRRSSKKAATRKAAEWPHRFDEIKEPSIRSTLVVPVVSSESRPYLPVGLLGSRAVISNKVFGILDTPLWALALVASKLHVVWIGTVCARMRTDFSYTNTLGWNTFPVPTLTENDKAALTRCAEDILLAREAHFPATIADLYNPEHIPPNLRAAHERNDETLERIYIGRRFKNDTERLEKLFEMYTKMVKSEDAAKSDKPNERAKRASPIKPNAHGEP
jgi:N-6 DNA Methylase